MKLELKHLSAYLPYGVKFISEMDKPYDEYGHQPIWTLNGISEMFGDYCLLTKQNSDAYDIVTCKPILRPLSDLSKEINYGLSTYAFTDLFEIGDCDGCIFEFEHGNIKTIKALENISKYNSYHDINYLPNAVVNMMYEYHFDIFGLIEKNLAIDINTI